MINTDTTRDGNKEQNLNKSTLSSSSSSSSFCKDLNEAENEMCITKCMNFDCFQKIYADEEKGGELEPGEVDEQRAEDFERCVKAYLKQQIDNKRISTRDK